MAGCVCDMVLLLLSYSESSERREGGRERGRDRREGVEERGSE